ncbi:MAG: AMP-binding protein [Bacteroidales bacterium]|nr:AMP-binding protein [Bacteroidales bacterium]MDD3667103.1 AMP-binding protein [Bacteroidales bacterium]
MSQKTEFTFPGLLAETVKKHGERPSLGFAGEKAITYNQLNNAVLSVSAFLEQLGIVPGTRVAILSTNMPNWGITYLAIVNIGAVVVPILPDFTPSEIENVLTHAGVTAIFVSAGLQQKLASIATESLRYQVRIEDFSVVHPPKSLAAYRAGMRPSGKYNIHENLLAAIIYTSGTTGKSKGVMLTHKNICFTAYKGRSVEPLNSFDRFLSVLPLSHTYENTIGLMLPLVSGASVYYLSKPPTPSVLLPALKAVRPTAMLTVPLIIEKIYHSKIKPAFHKNRLSRMLYAFPPTRRLMNRLAGKKLMAIFGGALKFYGIGGAKLSATVENFLLEARFPIAIGYGLTETAPLLAGSNPRNHKFQTTGPTLEGVTLKIHQPDSQTGEGEIWAKGPNVMKGYYREPALTKQVLTDDGWFKTGDLGVFDSEGFLSIKGRKKNVIVGANGENIYPEDIETVINNFKFVNESLVVEQQGKLVALVHFNREDIEAFYQSVKDEIHGLEEHCEQLRKELHHFVNSRLNRNSQIQAVVNHLQPFQKTATQKIKRFLYQEKHKS